MNRGQSDICKHVQQMLSAFVTNKIPKYTNNSEVKCKHERNTIPLTDKQNTEIVVNR